MTRVITVDRFLSAALASAIALSTTACVDTDPTGPKPAADPDNGLVDDGKTDGVSHLTTIRGPLAVGERVFAAIDYPEWFHGYTLELTAGTRITIDVDASAPGPVRLYGPARRFVDGEPRFDSALLRLATRPAGDRHLASFDFTADESGTYMVVHGPASIWYAEYSIGATGDTAATCADDSDCTDGFCGWTADNARVCKPWAQRGDSCGGFVLPANRSFCAPDLHCACNEPTCDTGGVCR